MDRRIAWTVYGTKPVPAWANGGVLSVIAPDLEADIIRHLGTMDGVWVARVYVPREQIDAAFRAGEILGLSCEPAEYQRAVVAGLL